MSSSHDGCLSVLFDEPFRVIVGGAIDRGVAKVRSELGDRGCFIALVCSALFVLILAVVLGLDWGLWVVLAVVLVLSVIIVGNHYRLGEGGPSGSDDQTGTDRRKVTSGPELVARHRAGERDFRHAKLLWSVLCEANLRGVDLSGADLRGTELGGATLREANLSDANLRGADLQRADLIGANLAAANLARVNLTGAKVSNRQLAQAASLKGATMPDGTVHK